MAKTVITMANGPVGQVLSANVTSYTSPLLTQEGEAEVTQANTQVTWRTAGIISDLYVYISANTIDTTSTIKLQVNGSTVNSTLSIAGDTTGEFKDTSSSDSVAAGDELNFIRETGTPGTSMNVKSMTFCFSATTNTVVKYGNASTGGVTVGASASNRFVSFERAVFQTVEGLTKRNFATAGTLKNMYVYFSANTRSLDMPFRSRIDGASGNLLVTVTASTTGAFEDTSNTDTIADGDLVNFMHDATGGTGSSTFQIIAVEFETTNSSFMTFTSSNTAMAASAGTDFYGVSGTNNLDNATSNNVKTDAMIAATISDLWVLISANTLDGATSMTLWKNGIDTALTLSITASTTGEFIDSSNSVTFVATDEVLIEFTEAAGTGSLTIDGMSELWLNTELSSTISGTITPSATESDIVTGGKTLIITIVGDTWIAAGAASFDLQRDEIIAGVTSAQGETLGWNLVPKALQSLGGVVRTSDTVVTITWDAFATYNITATETITVTVPATALVGGVGVVATPTFSVTPVGSSKISKLMLMGVG